MINPNAMKIKSGVVKVWFSSNLILNYIRSESQWLSFFKDLKKRGSFIQNQKYSSPYK